jgi:signal transduction histidine kinase
LLRRLAPGAWTVLAWAAVTGYGLVGWYAGAGYSVYAVPGVSLQPGDPHQFGLAGGPNAMYLVPAAALILAGSALLRRSPLCAFGLLLAAAVAGALGFSPSAVGFLQFLPADVAAYLIAAHRPRRTSATALALMVVSVACFAAARLLAWSAAGMLAPSATPGNQLPTEVAIILTSVVAWLVGTSGRQAREFADSHRAQAATAERLRISRELHDSVAHSIGIIAVLAGAASRVIQTQPGAAREALDSIEITSRDTLTGLQRMLTALRHAEPGTGGEGVPLAPAPGIADLDHLVAQAAGAGIRVSLDWRGERRPLPPEIDLSAFRIVQEAVTNVVRHSGTQACQVSVGYEADGLTIEITDDGRGHGQAGRAGGGFGLLGMRERVTMLSGQFSAGPVPEGGFRVAARLPA